MDGEETMREERNSVTIEVRVEYDTRALGLEKGWQAIAIRGKDDHC